MEILIYPPKVYTGEGKEIEYNLYNSACRDKRLGDAITHYVAAPGTGHITYRITRIDETGVYGEEIYNSVRELDPSEVI